MLVHPIGEEGRFCRWSRSDLNRKSKKVMFCGPDRVMYWRPQDFSADGQNAFRRSLNENHSSLSIDSSRSA